MLTAKTILLINKILRSLIATIYLLLMSQVLGNYFPELLIAHESDIEQLVIQMP